MLIAHAYIEVTDAEQGIAFYCGGVGLSVRRRLSPRWIELDGANLPIFLLAGRAPVADPGSTTAPRNYARHGTPVHRDFVSTDLYEVVSKILALGGTADREIQDREYGRIAYMAEPFGNGFDLIEFSGPGYDNVSRD